MQGAHSRSWPALQAFFFPKRRTLLTVIFGVLLFIPQLIVFLHTEGLPLIVGNIVLLIFPYLYLRGAYKNWKE